MNFTQTWKVIFSGLITAGMVALVFFLARYILLPGEVAWSEIPSDAKLYSFGASAGFVVASLSVSVLFNLIVNWARTRDALDAREKKSAFASIFLLAVGASLCGAYWGWLYD